QWSDIPSSLDHRSKRANCRYPAGYSQHNQSQYQPARLLSDERGPPMKRRKSQTEQTPGLGPGPLRTAKQYERVLLPPGVGGAKRRMTARSPKVSGVPTLTRRFAPPSSGGRGTSLYTVSRWAAVPATDAGFSLMELVVALGCFLIVTGAAFSMYMRQQTA